jgi:glucosamine kinase
MIVVGVDAGGTSTGALACTCEGKFIGYHVTGPGNYHNVGIDRAIENIREAIITATHNKIPDIACIGLAGLDSKYDFEILSRALNGIAKKTIIEHDSFIALYAETRGKPGIITISGTGSVVVAYDGKKRLRYGGEGWLLSDDGSAYWIGRKALRTLVKMLEGRIKKTRMGELIMDSIKVWDLDDLIKWAYHEGHKIDEIASLAKTVDKAAIDGDRVARDILLTAAKELAAVTIYAAKKISMNKVYLAGGMFTSKLYTEYFIGALREEKIEGTITKNSPEIGALLIALKDAGCTTEPEEPPLHF